MVQHRAAKTLTTTTLIGLTLIGCSSGSDKAKTAPPTSTTTPAPTPTPVPTVVPAAALGKIVLQKSDLLTGWTAKAYTPDPDDEKNNAQLYDCVGARNTQTDKITEQNSDDFTGPDGTLKVSSSAASYKSADDVRADIALFSSPKIAECLTTQFRSLLSKDLSPGEKLKVSVNVVPGTNGGPSNVVGATKVKATVTGPGGVQAIYGESYAIAGHTVQADVTFFNVGLPADADLQSSLVAKVAARLS